MKRMLPLLLALLLTLLTSSALSEGEWQSRVLPDGTVAITTYLGGETAETPAELNGLPVSALDAGAFSDNVRQITLPVTVTQIAEGAIPAGVTLRGYQGGAAEAYALSHGLAYENLSPLDFAEGVLDFSAIPEGAWSPREGGYLLNSAWGRLLSVGSRCYLPPHDGYVTGRVVTVTSIWMEEGRYALAASDTAAEKAYHSICVVGHNLPFDYAHAEPLASNVTIASYDPLRQKMNVRVARGGIRLENSYADLSSLSLVVDEDTFTARITIKGITDSLVWDTGENLYGDKTRTISVSMDIESQVTAKAGLGQSRKSESAYHNGSMDYAQTLTSPTKDFVRIPIYTMGVIRVDLVVRGSFTAEGVLNLSVTQEHVRLGFESVGKKSSSLCSWGETTQVDLSAAVKAELSFGFGITVSAPFIPDFIDFDARLGLGFEAEAAVSPLSPYTNGCADIGLSVFFRATLGAGLKPNQTKVRLINLQNIIDKDADLWFETTLIDWEKPIKSWHYETGTGFVDKCTRACRLILDPAMPGQTATAIYVRLGDTVSSGTLNSEGVYPSAAGYDFLGWFDPQTDQKYFGNDGLNTITVDDEEVRLVARWQKTDAEHPDMKTEYPSLSAPSSSGSINVHNMSDPQAVYVSAYPNYNFSVGRYRALEGDNSTVTSVYYGPIFNQTDGNKYSYNLTSLDFSDEMQYIGWYTGCTSLSSVHIPPKVTGLNASAFKDCVSLKSIVIPSTISRINADAFNGSGLESIAIPADCEVGPGAFSNCQDLKTIYLGAGSRLMQYNQNQGAFENDALELVTGAPAYIDSRTFQSVDSLDTLDLTSGTLECHLGAGDIRHIKINANTLSLSLAPHSNILEDIEITADTLTKCDINLYGCPNLRSVVIRANHYDGDTCEFNCLDSLAQSIVFECPEALFSLVHVESPTLENAKIDCQATEVSVNSCMALKEAEISLGQRYTNIYDCEQLESLTVKASGEDSGECSFYNTPRLQTLNVLGCEADRLNLSGFTGRTVFCTASLTLPDDLDEREMYPLHLTGMLGAEYPDWQLYAGEMVKLPTPTSTYSYTFQGWYLDEGYTQPVENAERFIMPEQETTLYASWTLPPVTSQLNDAGEVTSISFGGGPGWLPESMTVLKDCSVSSTPIFYVHGGVTRIEEGAFRGAYDLRVISVAADNPYYYDIDGVLYSRDGALLAVPNEWQGKELVIPEGITRIANHALRYVRTLTSLYIPSSVMECDDDLAYWTSQNTAVICEAGDQVLAALQNAEVSLNVVPVAFMSQGTLYNLSFVPVGNGIQIPTPAMSGYTFLGWSHAENGGVLPADYTVPLGGDVLYALWRENVQWLTLPAAVRTIEEEAFAGIAAEGIRCPASLRRVESRAFAGCVQIKYLRLPASVEYIAADALTGCENVTVIAPANSYAESWAQEAGFNVELEP